MDIFSRIAVPYNNFDKYFDKIYNSADIGYLKDDNGLELFSNISREFKLDPGEILIVDDNKTILEKAEKLGYKTYLYNIETCKDFDKWFNDNDEKESICRTYGRTD